MNSPLRYPGGKTRACKKLDEICNQYFDMGNMKTLLSPFFGGGSFEFFLHKQYELNVIANDKFSPLYNFWIVCKDDELKLKLCEMLLEQIDQVEKSTFHKYRSEIMECKDNLAQAVMYFIINRCSFSGATLSGGFSSEASKKRFTQSSIERITKLTLNDFKFSNLDFVEFLNNDNSDSSLIFLDPPYYLEKKSKLYGANGDMHSDFDHLGLHDYLTKNKHRNWIVTYNNCEFITDLYKDFKVLDVHWSYGMNSSKKSSEIVIVNSCK